MTNRRSMFAFIKEIVTVWSQVIRVEYTMWLTLIILVGMAVLGVAGFAKLGELIGIWTINDL